MQRQSPVQPVVPRERPGGDPYQPEPQAEVDAVRAFVLRWYREHPPWPMVSLVAIHRAGVAEGLGINYPAFRRHVNALVADGVLRKETRRDGRTFYRPG